MAGPRGAELPANGARTDETRLEIWRMHFNNAARPPAYACIDSSAQSRRENSNQIDSSR